MTTYKNFEDYLEHVFLADFHGTKDQCEDAFDRWLADLDGQEFIDHADGYAAIAAREAVAGAVAESQRLGAEIN